MQSLRPQEHANSFWNSDHTAEWLQVALTLAARSPFLQREFGNINHLQELSTLFFELIIITEALTCKCPKSCYMNLIHSSATKKIIKLYCHYIFESDRCILHGDRLVSLLLGMRKSKASQIPLVSNKFSSWTLSVICNIAWMNIQWGKKNWLQTAVDEILSL